MASTVISADVVAKVTASANGIAVVANLPIKTPRVKTVVATPGAVLGGKPVSFVVTLSGVAPASGTTLTVTASNGAISIPSPIKVAAGKSTATFVGTSSAVSSVTECTVRVAASGEYIDTVVVVRPTVVKTLVISPGLVVGGSKATVTVTLTEAAPVGGASVNLESTSPRFEVPSFVTIPAGKTTAVLSIQTPAVSTVESVQVAAKLGGGTLVSSVSVVPVALASFTAAPTSVKSGGTVVLTLKLASVSAVPVDVILTTTDAGLLPIPARLTIPAGQLTLQQLVSVGSTSVKKSVALTAATQAVAKPLTINVTP